MEFMQRTKNVGGINVVRTHAAERGKLEWITWILETLQTLESSTATLETGNLSNVNIFSNVHNKDNTSNWAKRVDVAPATECVIHSLSLKHNHIRHLVYFSVV